MKVERYYNEDGYTNGHGCYIATFKNMKAFGYSFADAIKRLLNITYEFEDRTPIADEDYKSE